VLAGDTWIEITDIPKDNLVKTESWGGNNSNELDLGGVYKDWLLTEVKERRKLYVKATFNVDESLLTSNPLPLYGLTLTFNTNKTFTKNVNDMIGNPFNEGSHEQLFCFDFTEAEAAAITDLTSITLDKAGAKVTITNIVIYGIYSPDLNSSYPIECRIYKTVDDTNIEVTSSLLNDVSSSGIKFTAQVSQGSVNLLEASTTYQWTRYDFDWDNLTWAWSDWSKNNDAQKKDFIVSNANAFYPITKFKCIVKYDGVEYESPEI
jgi:hypothetical protein